MILIGEIDILHALFGRVVIPPAVQDELTNFRAPEIVRLWIAQPPFWLEVLTPTPVTDATLAGLDAGEREAIRLAEELSTSLGPIQLIVDELLGRREAERRGLRVIGTIGVLREAASLGFLDLRGAIERLRQTSFHISPAILARLLENET
jgi:predicted nucleic acid-binding protein